jgi:hypothetical protein
MKLENISKIFGVLAFISFIAAVMEVVITKYGTAPKYTFIGATIIFILAGIMATLKRIARDMERNGKE